VLITWTTATTESSPRYGRTYCRSSAQSISLLSHMSPPELFSATTPVNWIKTQVNRHAVVEASGCRYSAWRDPEHVRDR
jgi:hypothetical protein